MAMDKSTGLWERITIPKDKRKKYDHVGRPCYTKIPIYAPVHTHKLTLLQRLQISISHKKYLAKLRKRHLKYIEQERLMNRLHNLPSQDYDTSPTHKFFPDPVYVPPPPIPSDLHFQRSPTLAQRLEEPSQLTPLDTYPKQDAVLKRIKEFEGVLQATKIRLEPVFRELNSEEYKEYNGQAFRISNQDRNSLWGWYNDLEDLYQDLDKRGHQLSNKNWREIKGICTKIGKVNFQSLYTRLPEICKELLDLNIVLPDAAKA
ncbi:hypothetical protein EV360DRAFT_76828 [Lentinula raphanica]|nr:hypothetical protein EV360DRAFT_76828 [Lentinula raphanica]